MTQYTKWTVSPCTAAKFVFPCMSHASITIIPDSNKNRHVVRTCDYRYLTDESVLVIVYFDSLSRPFCSTDIFPTDRNGREGFFCNKVTRAKLMSRAQIIYNLYAMDCVSVIFRRVSIYIFTHRSHHILLKCFYQTLCKHLDSEQNRQEKVLYEKLLTQNALNRQSSKCLNFIANVSTVKKM